MGVMAIKIKTFSILVFLSVFSTASTCSAGAKIQEMPIKTKPKSIDLDPEYGTNEEQFLAAHNEARAKKGLDPLTWDLGLENFSEDWARYLGNHADCALIHSQSDRYYGENIAKFWGDRVRSGADAVALWIKEEQFYDYKTNSCEEGKVCGHYTQVVWRDTKKLGCAVYWCPTEAKDRFKKVGVFVCQYSPAGNYIGRKPY